MKLVPATPLLLATLGLATSLSLGVPADDPRYDGSVEQARGFYSHGSLVHADALSEMANESWLKLQQPRRLHYATYDLVQILETSARALHAANPDGEPLQIGDMARETGGELPLSERTRRALSASHQNGLDVDLVFPRVDHATQDPQDVSGFAETFVTKDHRRVTPNLDLARTWTLLKILHATGRLERVFVATPIKRALCAYAKKKGEYDARTELLRALRPLDSHHDHLHVRISCPKNSFDCEPQSPPPPGAGCGL